MKSRSGIDIRVARYAAVFVLMLVATGLVGPLPDGSAEA